MDQLLRTILWPTICCPKHKVILKEFEDHPQKQQGLSHSTLDYIDSSTSKGVLISRAKYYLLSLYASTWDAHLQNRNYVIQKEERKKPTHSQETKPSAWSGLAVTHLLELSDRELFKILITALKVHAGKLGNMHEQIRNIVK